MIPAELTPVDDMLFVQIQRFLFREAGLLDRRQYADWLALTTPDIRYCIMAAVSRDAGVKAVEYAIVDCDATGLKSRIDQISNPKLTRAENPPSMMRRAITNMEAFHTTVAEEVVVTSYLLAYRARPHLPEGGFYVASRQDTLRRIADGWRIARRDVRLDQTVLFDGALSSLL